jgi:hypothetical protein
MARSRGVGDARPGGVCLHRRHELCGAGGRAQAALWHEPDGLRLATDWASPLGLRSGLERQCAWGNPAASTRWHTASSRLGRDAEASHHDPAAALAGAQLPFGGYRPPSR